jgi:hypothetical protein
LYIFIEKEKNMEDETFSDYLDELYDTFEEVLEEARNFKNSEDFKMHVYFKMREVATKMPKICVDLALKEWTKI